MGKIINLKDKKEALKMWEQLSRKCEELVIIYRGDEISFQFMIDDYIDENTKNNLFSIYEIDNMDKHACKMLLSFARNLTDSGRYITNEGKLTWDGNQMYRFSLMLLQHSVMHKYITPEEYTSEVTSLIESIPDEADF